MGFATRYFLCPLLVLFAAVSPANARIISVKANGAGDYPTIQAAINAAAGVDLLIFLDAWGSLAGEEN